MALRISAGVAALIIWLIVLMPLKAVLMLAGSAGVSGYQEVYGTVWDGRIRGLRLAGLPIEDVHVALRPLGLITGRLVADWQIADTSARGHGRLALGATGFTLSQTDLSLQLSRIAVLADTGLDPQERIFLTIDQLEINGATCRIAEGEVRSAALVSLARSFELEGPVVEGPLTCRDGALVLDLAGETSDLSLDAELLLAGDGFDWQVETRTGRAELADGFALAGLERDGDVWRRSGHSGYGRRND
tara:strand:+ start:10328 stop:11065 length:738 start_codon:yes stop_codon:yes gene_type:complete